MTEKHARNAVHILGTLTDYAPNRPSLLYKAIYLTECEREMNLAPEVKSQLGEIRREIRQACGIR